MLTQAPKGYIRIHKTTWFWRGILILFWWVHWSFKFLVSIYHKRFWCCLPSTVGNMIYINLFLIITFDRVLITFVLFFVTFNNLYKEFYRIRANHLHLGILALRNIRFRKMLKFLTIWSQERVWGFLSLC